MNDRIVVTVIGEDKTGIVANVSTKLSELRLNIIDTFATIPVLSSPITVTTILSFILIPPFFRI